MGLYTDNQIKARPVWWTPIAYDRSPHKNRHLGHTQRDDQVKTQEEDDHLRGRRGLGQSFPRSPQEEPTLPTPGFWASGLQNCEKIHFCRLSLSFRGTLVQQSQETNS